MHVAILNKPSKNSKCQTGREVLDVKSSNSRKKLLMKIQNNFEGRLQRVAKTTVKVRKTVNEMMENMKREARYRMQGMQLCSEKT